MSTATLTGRENLTKYAFRSGPIRPTNKENQVQMYKMYDTVLSRLPLWNSHDPDQTVKSGSVSKWKAGSVSKGSGSATLAKMAKMAKMAKIYSSHTFILFLLLCVYLTQ
jgi:hypothetical protein